MLSTYPIDLFGGGAKLLLYTVVPSAFVASVPSSLIDRWDARSALGLVAVTAAFAAVANVSFRAALRRYSSGSAWTRA